MEVGLKDSPHRDTESKWLKDHIFEHSGFHIDGEYQLLEANRPIPKFHSTQEVAETIRKFIADRKKS